jgi:hypothetical protein
LFLIIVWHVISLPMIRSMRVISEFRRKSARRIRISTMIPYKKWLRRRRSLNWKRVKQSPDVSGRRTATTE